MFEQGGNGTASLSNENIGENQIPESPRIPSVGLSVKRLQYQNATRNAVHTNILEHQKRQEKERPWSFQGRRGWLQLAVAPEGP